MKDDLDWLNDLGENSVVWDRAKRDRIRRRAKRVEAAIAAVTLAVVVFWVWLIMRVMT